MKPLIIKPVKGEKRTLQALGWKTPKAGEMRLQFYALGETSQPLVLSLTPAVPQFWTPSYPVVATLEPFPEAVCLEITPCRLLAPPCYQSQQEFQSQLLGHYVFDRWRAVYWDTHREVLVLEPEDDLPLQERLDEWLAMMQLEYEREAHAWRENIERLRTAALVELGIKTEDERASLVMECQKQLAIVESENPIEGVPCKGRLKLTLSEVKQGHEGLRDAWMREKWAAKSGEDLVAMSRERRRFRNWLVSHTGTPADVFDARTKQSCRSLSPPTLGEGFENNPQFLEACAKVRYRARFADNAGTVVLLADCELREELDAVELDDVARLRGMPPNAIAAFDKATAALTAAGDHVLSTGENAAKILTIRSDHIEAVAIQLEAKTRALDEVISPLNRLYAEVEIAEIRKRAAGKGVPELFVDWVLTRFQASEPPRLPTKGDAFDHCGPGTLIGNKLKEAGVGISKQRFADHLTVVRRLLEQKGWLSPAGPGKSRKRASNFQPDDGLEDINQPSPAESAGDRDEERGRKAVGLDTDQEDAENPDAD